MATAKKTPAKKTAAKKAAKPEKLLVMERTVAKVKADQKFVMPMEVKNWIDQAHSTINHLRGEVERLKTENKELKSYKRWAEQRILRSDYE